MYRSNATLGINKIDYIIASGIKQKNINDIFDLESFLKLDRIRPLQSSYTQTAVDRETERTENDKGTSENSGIEPSQK